ncbi:sensor histidine kinase [Pseudomonas syringae pv. tagetis]|uniref:Sensor histidine kinase n=2 Tax=Pseudomonas syringae group genomosp. 7 TaxID=251699 RepID=A0A0N8T496_9PSED|nr:sensor histidine kinase [Pseudomonas syringae group genomosp. 7]KPX45163.1 Sensor histidine kinase [Pseudomonas syringae pv. helianthi]KPY87776.1 Sensor histidine kinase [Pseudomonas syringae pv. tagetis]RMR02276.1 Sensor histidine kinase [Pseudomonas syringae pv. helianthi]RMW13940.1 Sensor histidine kinase [Pseudomonas syringae pv. tagetis]RMW26604.1 Sensor histidine kinase [Pseudomonas syringae pv. tagetis]
MQSPPHDPASALAIRNQYRQSQSRAARLRLLVDTGQELTQLPPEAMRRRVLQRACAFVAMDHGLLLEWGIDNSVQSTASHGSAERLSTLETAADPLAIGPQWLERSGRDLPCVLLLPLRGADEGCFGTLLLANSVSINAPDNEDIESLQLLATLLAAHLENNRLLEALVVRERTMSELVRQLFTAQEDERKRMAYDLHDGLAQTLAGLHQRLQGFAGRCPELPEPLDADLQAILKLAQHCVGEGRQLISGLRPSVLDDFGLLQAVDKEADRLREAGIAVQWTSRSQARLPSHLEIALFRIAQEGINNVFKHASASRVELALELNNDTVSLSLEDNGRGFITEKPRNGNGVRKLGLVAMQERASLLGGRLTCISRLERGTRLRAIVPFTADKAMT